MITIWQLRNWKFVNILKTLVSLFGKSTLHGTPSLLPHFEIFSHLKVETKKFEFINKNKKLALKLLNQFNSFSGDLAREFRETQPYLIFHLSY
jgi:hypothetical protein